MEEITKKNFTVQLLVFKYDEIYKNTLGLKAKQLIWVCLLSFSCISKLYK